MALSRQVLQPRGSAVNMLRIGSQNGRLLREVRNENGTRTPHSLIITHTNDESARRISVLKTETLRIHAARLH